MKKRNRGKEVNDHAVIRVVALYCGLLLGSLQCASAAGGIQVTLRGSWPGYERTNGFAEAVDVAGRYAYVADAVGGLQIIDRSNPSAPIRVGRYDTGGYAQDVQVADHLAYVADLFGGLQVIDVRDPAHPAGVGSYDTGGRVLKFYESPNALHVVDALAYVAAGDGDLQVIDVSNPTNPVRVGGYPTMYAHGVRVAGDRAYVAGGRDVGDDHVGFLQIFDLSEPTNPVPIGFTDTASYGYGVDVTGHYAYVVGEDAALTVVNVSDPTNPVPVASFRTNGWAESVQVRGRYAFLAGEFIGLLVMDLTDPANPLPVADYPLGTGEDAGWDVQVAANHAYLARGHSGLLVFEIARAPIKSIIRTGEQVVLTWDGAPGLKLQKTSSLSNPDWTDVPGSEGQSQIELPLSNGTEFFRLAMP